MKRKIFYLFLSLFFLSIQISCNKNPDLTGDWFGAKGGFLNITQNGDTYTIKWDKTITVSGKYSDGIILTGGGMGAGDPVYSEDTKTITWLGDVWKKVEEIPLQKQ